MRIGRHINISHGFISAPRYAKSIGCDVMQIFVTNPQRLNSKQKSDEEIKKFAEELDKHDINMVIHASYTINLCHHEGYPNYINSINSLVNDMKTAHKIGKRCMGTIIHMGKNVKSLDASDEEAIENYIVGIKEVLSKTPNDTTLILETGASQGNEVGSRITEMGIIYDGLTKNEQKRVKFCIDTCHIWATGYDISTKDGVKKYFRIFDKHIGIDKIVCIHFNDSKNKLRSCVDRHEDLGFGEIGSEGLKQFAIVAKKYGIPLIAETPLSNDTPQSEVKKIRKWIKN